MGRFIKEIGRMIGRKVLDVKSGRMAAGTKAASRMARRMVKGLIPGPTATPMWGIGKTISCMALEFILGLMVGSTEAIGSKTRCTGREFYHGPMVEAMLVTTSKIKKMGLGITLGRMGRCLQACGKTVNVKAKVLIICYFRQNDPSRWQ